MTSRPPTGRVDDDREPLDEVEDRYIRSSEHCGKDDDRVERSVEHAEADHEKAGHHAREGGDDVVRRPLLHPGGQRDGGTGEHGQRDHDGQR